jgi:hypothetical protein
MHHAHSQYIIFYSIQIIYLLLSIAVIMLTNDHFPWLLLGGILTDISLNQTKSDITTVLHLLTREHTALSLPQITLNC